MRHLRFWVDFRRANGLRSSFIVDMKGLQRIEEVFIVFSECCERTSRE